MRIPISVLKIPIKATADNNSLRSLLSEDEKERAGSYIFQADQWRYVFCRANLRIKLGELLNCPPNKILFGYSVYGKPYLIEYPELKFNLSHCSNYLAMIFSSECEVGIDIEPIREVDYQSLGKICLSKKESLELDSYLGESKKLEAFFTCWTRKEALLKGIGLGIGTGLGLLEEVNCFLNNIEFVMQHWTLTSLPVGESHALACACSIMNPQIYLQKMSNFG